MPERTDGDQRLLTAWVNGEYLGLPLELVREVVELDGELTPVMGAPPWLAGLLNHHGQVVTVLHAAAVLGTGGAAAGRQVVLVDVNDDRLGLLVERVEAVEQVPAEKQGMAGGLGWHRSRPLRVLDRLAWQRFLDGRLPGRGEKPAPDG